MTNAQRIVQTLELLDDPELIKFYRAAHRPENIWPEIPQGIRSVGITRMDIFIDVPRLISD
ncbi:MAG: L-rhamnose mutarotase [Bacteroidales bacterium]|nr:L-rhamnose mutarotase [Bacteroidales bacterium]